MQHHLDRARSRMHGVAALLVLLAFAHTPVAGCSEDQAAEGPWPLHPRVVRGTAPLGYVTNNLDDTLSVIELATMHELARVSVGLVPIDPEAPHHLAIDEARGFVYVGLSNILPSGATGPHAGHTGGTRDGYVQRLHLSDLTEDSDFRVDPELGDIALAPGGARVLTTHFDLNRAIAAAANGSPPEDAWANLVVGDTSTMRRTARIPVGVAPHGMDVTADGSTALVACYGDDRVTFVDLTTRPPEVVARVAMGSAPADLPPARYGPYSVRLSPDGTRAYVGNLESKDLRVIDVATRALVPEATLELSGAVYFGAPSPDGAELFVPTQGADGLHVVDTARHAVVRARSFHGDECYAPHEVTFVQALGRIVLVCEGDRRTPGKVIALDPATLETTGETAVGLYPDALRVANEVTW